MPEPPIVGAHELGDYVYCERAWWYDHHPPSASAHPMRDHDAYARGQEFQEHLLRAHVRAQRNSGAPYAAAALAGLGLIAVILWEYHLFPTFWSWHW